MESKKERFIKAFREKCRVKRCKGIGTTCAKMLLILANFTFLVTGVALIALGIWIHINRDTLFYTYLLRFNQSSTRLSAPLTILESQSPAVAALSTSSSSSSSSAAVPYDIVSIDSSPFLLIIAGCCVATVGFLGCCGAYAESVCFLGFYSVLTVLVIVAEITIIAVSSGVKQDFEFELLGSLRHQIQYSYNATAQQSNQTQSDVYKLTLAWNTLQTYLNCCGAVGPPDYTNSNWHNHTPAFTGVYVPPTCCQLTNRDPVRPEVGNEAVCQVEALWYLESDGPVTELHTQGCHEALIQWINSHEHVVISLLCNVIILQVVNVVFACLLIGWIRKKHSEYSWCDIEEYQ